MTSPEEVNYLVSDSDDRAIRELVSEAQRLQIDTAALMDLHRPDVVIVNIAGHRVLDREAFANAMIQALASPLADVRTTVEVVDIRLPSPDIAIVSCIKTVHDERGDFGSAGSLPNAGALTYVMTRMRHTWRIALAQTTPSPS
jgi:uncharacterized protein (TIGR02246 family)